MRQAALFKVPGLHICRLSALTAFIEGEENRQIEDVSQSLPKRSNTAKYVTLLSADRDSLENQTPTYKVSVSIVTEHWVTTGGQGMRQTQTPRRVLNKIFDLLGIFPENPE